MVPSIDRYEWVDYAKAIGILLVVYGHVARGLVSAGLMLDSTLHEYVDSIIYTFHMPLFFFLSGLFLITSFQSKGVGKTLGSKVDTIVYPYVLWSLLQGGVEFVLSAHTNGNVSLGEVLSLFTSPRAQFWFLYALFLVFFTSLVALYVFGIKVFPALFMLSAALYLWSPKLDFIVNICFFSSNLVFFLMGVVFQQFKLMRFNSTYLLVIITLIAAVGQYLFHSNGFTSADKSVLLLVLSTSSLLAIVSLSEWLLSFDFSFIAYVGASSMAIYLMHILAGSGVRVIFSKVLDIDSVVLHLLLGTLLGILLPLIALKLINFFKFPYAFSFPISQLYFKKRPKLSCSNRQAD
jgi:fucose 4-O-acetylase-like acetyltransferase